MGKPNFGGDRAGRENWAESVDKVMKNFEARLESGDVKLTTAEYLKLAELQDQDELREIKITWVEPATTESSNEA
jgi:hypothetical protein